MSMTTTIPPTIFDQIVQTKLSPVTIAVLLNAMENLYSDRPKRYNQKRVYPSWKHCPRCGKPFPVENVDQMWKKNHCSEECVRTAQVIKRFGEGSLRDYPVEKTCVKCKATFLVNNAGQFQSRTRCKKCRRVNGRRKAGKIIKCAVCGKKKFRHDSHLKRVKTPTCSTRCNGILRGKEWAKHGHKGRAGWTEESRESYNKKMTGPNNPAWKGGVTYRKRKGNYANYSIKYVKCPEEFISMSRKDGYVMEHRLKVAQALGRPLKRSEIVHHINHNPEDNRIENLMLFSSNTAHKKYEATGNPQPLWQP